MDEYPYLNEALASVLQKRREELKLSKRKLAALARLERVYIVRLEKGEKRPTLNALFYLSEALEIRPHEFVKLVEDELEKQSDNRRIPCLLLER